MGWTNEPSDEIRMFSVCPSNRKMPKNTGPRIFDDPKICKAISLITKPRIPLDKPRAKSRMYDNKSPKIPVTVEYTSQIPAPTRENTFAFGSLKNRMKNPPAERTEYKIILFSGISFKFTSNR